MQGSKTKILDYMEGNKVRMTIPVYQRKYDWKQENCRQLFTDLVRVMNENRNSHFFGSIVSSMTPEGNNYNHQIIDGQQRLTTVSLLLAAIKNLIESGQVQCSNPSLALQIKNAYLISPYAAADDQIKLRLISEDQKAYQKILAGDEEEYTPSSNLTLNYRYLEELIRSSKTDPEALFEAIGKLEVINIALEQDDEPQLIFESLNSTGLALSEGDKVRNFVLMNLDPQSQTKFYESYWKKVEERTGDEISSFLRDFLGVKTGVLPKLNAVYPAFKNYASEQSEGIETLLKDLTRYASYFETLQKCRTKSGSKKADESLERLKRLDNAVVRPYMMEVLDHYSCGQIDAKDMENLFELVESFLIRRIICSVPSNSLIKVFMSLDREAEKLDGTFDQYYEKIKYLLLKRKESSRFPDNLEFSEQLRKKDVYKMKPGYKTYLLERFENYGTAETRDIYRHLDDGDYSIEHIMPQNLTIEWQESLGKNAEEIHERWLHRLANLTLTAYNSKYSDKPFLFKRDTENGFMKSGLRMNQEIARLDEWKEPQLRQREDRLISLALKIWEYPQTEYVPARKVLDTVSLDDDSFTFTGRTVCSYSLQGKEQNADSWADMFSQILHYLHGKDQSVMTEAAYAGSENNLSAYFSANPKLLRHPESLDDKIWFEANTNTEMKISALRKLFKKYGILEEDLVITLNDEKKVPADGKKELKKNYWSSILPDLKKLHSQTGLFAHTSDSVQEQPWTKFPSMPLILGIVLNDHETKVILVFDADNPEINRNNYERLYANKDLLEAELNCSVLWENNHSKNKPYRLTCSLKNLGSLDTDQWPEIRQFHLNASKRIYDFVEQTLVSE